MRRLLITVVTFALALVHQHRCFGEQPAPSIAEIEKVWKARQDKVEAAVFELETGKTIYKGSSSEADNSILIKLGKPPMPESPPRDYLVKGTRRFSFSGVNTHDSYEDQAWDPIGNRLYSTKCVEVFNGKLFKSLDNPSSGQENYPAGIIKKAPQAGGALKFPLLPILLTLRGVHPDYFNSLSQFRLSGNTVPIAGRSCLELVRASQRGQGQEVLFVDPERDYVVAKMVILDEGKPTWQWTAKYRTDATVGWVPYTWEYLLLTRKGHRTGAGRRTVVRYEINAKLDDSEFDIRFPPGTKVDDEVSFGQYVVYTISETGERNRVVPAVQGSTYDELQRPTPRVRRWLWLWGAVLVLSLTGGVWLRKRHRRRAA